MQAGSRLIQAFEQSRLAGFLLTLGERFVLIDIHELCADIRQHESLRVAGADNLAPLLHEVSIVSFFIHSEVEFLLEFEELQFAGVLIEEEFIFLHHAAEFGVLLGAHVGAVAGLTQLDLEETAAGTLRIALLSQLVGFIHERGAELNLLAHYLFDERFEGIVLLLALDDGRAGNDERCAGFIDKNGVHLVDNGEVVSALHLSLSARRHTVVAQVVKAELGVGAVGDIALVLAAAQITGHHALDAAHSQTEEGEQGAHPHRVTAGQVVIHCHHMDTQTGEGVQIHRKRCHERFTLTRGHFRDETAMQGNTTQQLHLKVNHIPANRRAADIHILAAHEFGSALDHGKGLRKNILQIAGAHAVKLRFNLRPDFLTGLDGFRSRLHLGQFGELGFESLKAGIHGGSHLLQQLWRRGENHTARRQIHGCKAVQIGLPLAGLTHQKLPVFSFPGFFNIKNPAHDRIEFAHLALVLGTHDFVQNPLNHNTGKLLTTRLTRPRSRCGVRHCSTGLPLWQACTKELRKNDTQEKALFVQLFLLLFRLCLRAVVG